METVTNIKQNKMYYSLIDDVNLFLSSNPGKAFTSYEIDELMNSIPYQKLKSALSSCGTDSFADPSLYLNSLCNHLSKKRIINKSSKFCTKLNKLVDAYSI